MEWLPVSTGCQIQWNENEWMEFTVKLDEEKQNYALLPEASNLHARKHTHTSKSMNNRCVLTYGYVHRHTCTHTNTCVLYYACWSFCMVDSHNYKQHAYTNTQTRAAHIIHDSSTMIVDAHHCGNCACGCAFEISDGMKYQLVHWVSLILATSRRTRAWLSSLLWHVFAY